MSSDQIAGLLAESKNESSPKQPIEEDNGRPQNVDSADQETPRAEAPPLMKIKKKQNLPKSLSNLPKY